MQQKNRAGEHEYRDDRMFVMNLHPCGGGRWQLITYRNTGLLPGVRSDDFDSFEEAERYVKKWESTVPLQSLSGRPMDLDHMETDDERYNFYLNWLEERGLFGAMKLYRHCPYWHDPRGWTEKRAAVRVKTESSTFEGMEVEVTETSFPFREQ